MSEKERWVMGLKEKLLSELKKARLREPGWEARLRPVSDKLWAAWRVGKLPLGEIEKMVKDARRG